jgi:hypothetical protein
VLQLKRLHIRAIIVKFFYETKNIEVEAMPNLNLRHDYKRRFPFKNYSNKASKFKKNDNKSLKKILDKQIL